MQLAMDHEVRRVIRSDEGDRMHAGTNTETHVVGEIGPHTRWERVLRGMEGVVHLAAKVHVIQQPTQAVRDEYQRVNVNGTEMLARAAADAGVKRFVYLSTVKVQGEATPRYRPFVESDKPEPRDLYGESKWGAEQSLASVSRDTGMEVVILRPPMIYGAGVKANFLSLLRAVERGWPLPLGRVNNRRSLIYVENLADAVTKCLHHPDAAGRTFLVADAAISIADLVRKLSAGLGRRARLFPVPVAILRGVGTLLGKSSTVEKVTSSLVVDCGEIQRIVGWRPPISMEDGLRATCNWYKSAYRHKGSRGQ